VTATTGNAAPPIERANPRARAMTCRWPRCTPSKLPIVTTHGPFIGSEAAPATTRQIVTGKLCHAIEQSIHAGRNICDNLLMSLATRLTISVVVLAVAAWSGLVIGRMTLEQPVAASSNTPIKLVETVHDPVGVADEDPPADIDSSLDVVAKQTSTFSEAKRTPSATAAKKNASPKPATKTSVSADYRVVKLHTKLVTAMISTATHHADKKATKKAPKPKKKRSSAHNRLK